MPTVKAGNRMCQPITQANCRRDSRTGSRSMVDLLLPSATRRTNAPHPRAQAYSDAAAKASPRIPNSFAGHEVNGALSFGTKRTWRNVCPFVRFRGKADIDQVSPLACRFYEYKP